MLTDPLAHKRATHVAYTANLTNMHLHATYLETEELEGHFRRFLNDPELLKRLQSPKIWKIRQKNPKMLQIIKAEVHNTCLKHIHID